MRVLGITGLPRQRAQLADAFVQLSLLGHVKRAAQAVLIDAHRQPTLGP